MAPHPGVDTEQIKEQARKDLLDLLEGVCKAHLDQDSQMRPFRSD